MMVDDPWCDDPSEVTEGFEAEAADPLTPPASPVPVDENPPAAAAPAADAAAPQPLTGSEPEPASTVVPAPFRPFTVATPASAALLTLAILASLWRRRVD